MTARESCSRNASPVLHTASMVPSWGFSADMTTAPASGSNCLWIKASASAASLFVSTGSADCDDPEIASKTKEMETASAAEWRMAWRKVLIGCLRDRVIPNPRQRPWCQAEFPAPFPKIGPPLQGGGLVIRAARAWSVKWERPG